MQIAPQMPHATPVFGEPVKPAKQTKRGLTILSDAVLHADKINSCSASMLRGAHPQCFNLRSFQDNMGANWEHSIFNEHKQSAVLKQTHIYLSRTARRFTIKEH